VISSHYIISMIPKLPPRLTVAIIGLGLTFYHAILSIWLIDFVQNLTISQGSSVMDTKVELFRALLTCSVGWNLSGIVASGIGGLSSLLDYLPGLRLFALQTSFDTFFSFILLSILTLITFIPSLSLPISNLTCQEITSGEYFSNLLSNDSFWSNFNSDLDDCIQRFGSNLFNILLLSFMVVLFRLHLTWSVVVHYRSRSKSNSFYVEDDVEIPLMIEDSSNNLSNGVKSFDYFVRPQSRLNQKDR